MQEDLILGGNIMTFETVQKVIAEKMELDPASIKMDSSLQDLEIDSLDMVEIIMGIEEEMGVSLEELKDVATVGEVVAYIDAQK